VHNNIIHLKRIKKKKNVPVPIVLVNAKVFDIASNIFFSAIFFYHTQCWKMITKFVIFYVLAFAFSLYSSVVTRENNSSTSINIIINFKYSSYYKFTIILFSIYKNDSFLKK